MKNLVKTKKGNRKIRTTKIRTTKKHNNKSLKRLHKKMNKTRRSHYKKGGVYNIGNNIMVWELTPGKSSTMFMSNREVLRLENPKNSSYYLQNGQATIAYDKAVQEFSKKYDGSEGAKEVKIELQTTSNGRRLFQIYPLSNYKLYPELQKKKLSCLEELSCIGNRECNDNMQSIDCFILRDTNDNKFLFLMNRPDFEKEDYEYMEKHLKDCYY